MAETKTVEPKTAEPKADALFAWIEQRERERSAASGAWGRVLDAGTGRHSLQWLTGLARREPGAISHVVAVTGEPALAAALEREFPAPEPMTMRVVSGNWQDAGFLAREPRFDVIVADYLVGAIEGFAPYYQEQVCERLRRLLKPGGRMYMIGLHPLSESSSVEQSEAAAGELIREMARTRDACILLGDQSCYREFPVTWYQRQLKLAGLREFGCVKMSNVYSHETVGRQLQVARNQLPLFRDAALAASMETAIADLNARVAATFGSSKVRFGFDFVIAAALSK